MWIRKSDIRQVFERAQRYTFLASNPRAARDEQLNPKCKGWRKTVTAAAILAASVLVINSVLALVVSLKFPPTNGVGTIYEGDCGTVKRWNTGVHLVLNVLSTVLLAASNYTMQCLNAPTRSEVDAAHARRVTLDIGQSSLRNLFYLGHRKGILWMCLCLTSLPLHMFWNSTIFMTIGTHSFSYIIADASFLSGASYKTPPEHVQNKSSYFGDSKAAPVCDLSTLIPTSTFLEGYQRNRYTNLTAIQCLNIYTANLLSDNRNLIVISSPQPDTAVSECGCKSQKWNDSSVFNITVDESVGTDWLGFGEPSIDTTRRLAQLKDQVREGEMWQLGEYPVLYCLSETQGVSRCKLQYAMYIYVVIVCNAVKVICMCLTLHHLSGADMSILATIGDAAASFIEQPDETTRGWCLLDHQSLREGAWRQQKIPQEYYRTYNRRSTTTLFTATNTARWCITILFCTTYLLVGIVCSSIYITGVTSNLGLTQAFQLKFGAMDPKSLLGLSDTDTDSLLLDVVIANSWQMVLSVTYFLYNALYTAQCTAIEWASYATKRKALRVSWPRGKQRSTYYLQLPYRYALPLTAMLALMHFLVAESIFLARVENFYDSNEGSGAPLYGSSDMDFTDVGVSPVAAVIALLVAACLIIAQVLFASRRLDNRMPMHGNRSVVISAMCHAHNDSSTQGETMPEQEEISTQLVMWGVTEEPKDLGIGIISEFAGHCSFTNKAVEMPQYGRQYT